MLKNGGVLSLEANYLAVGRQTALMIKKILQEQKSLSSLGLEFPNKHEVGINLKMARFLKVDIPESKLKRADYIFR